MNCHRTIICLTIAAAILPSSEELLAQPDPAVVAPDDPVVAPPVRRRNRFLQSSRTQRGRRLVSTPPVFGDPLLSPVLEIDTGADFVTASLQMAGGSGRLKIADQNKAIPVDRAFFHYNHYDGGANISRGPAFGVVTKVDSRNVDLFTVGLEKTFGCGQSSIEFRMPFSASIDYSSADLSLDSGDIGNLSVIFKRMWFETDTYGVSFGSGVVTPTGGDVHGEMPGVSPGTTFDIENRAVNVVPFIGIAGAPTDNFFYHGFMQFDIPLNGNKITVTDAGTTTGFMSDQVVFSLDLAAGYWFYRDCHCNHIQGLAGMIELHSNSSTTDADVVTISSPTFGMREARLENANMTLGLHAEVANNTALRVGWGLPLSELGQRFFYSEILFSLQRHY